MPRPVVFNDASTWVEAVWAAIDGEEVDPDEVHTAMAWIEEALGVVASTDGV